MYRPLPSIGSKSCLWVVGWMYQVDVIPGAPRVQYGKGRSRSFRRRTMPPPGHIPETVAPGAGGDHHLRRLRGFGSSHGNAARRVRLRIQRPRRWRGPGHRPAGQVHSARGQPPPYIVNTPSQEGVYPFSGMLRDSDRKDTPAGGTSWGRATVQQPSNPGPLCAQRTTRPPFLSRRRPFSLGPAAGPPLSLTTTVLPVHLVRSTNGEYETPLFAEHFPVAGAVP